MSLSTYLQNSDVMRAIQNMDHRQLKDYIVARGSTWFADTPAECATIRENLQLFGLPHDEAALEAVKHHILLHYYEKLIGVCYQPKQFHQFLHAHVDATAALETLGAIKAQGKAVVCAISHFGGVELLAPTLASHGHALSIALRFSTPQLSALVHARAQSLRDSGLFAPISFIEIGKPGTVAALEMAAVVRAGGIMTSVFDEETEYSLPVDLLEKRLWGGAGLDKLVKYARAPLALVAAFMVRTDAERYTLVVKEVPQQHPAPIQALYDALAPLVQRHSEQWYFLHETLPLVSADA